MSKKTLTYRALHAFRPMGLLVARLTALALLAGIVFFQGTTGLAEDYIQLKVDTRLERAWRSKLSDVLVEGFKSGEEEAFDQYYKKCVFPEWTVPSNYTVKDSSKTLKTPRRKLLNNFKAAESEPVHDRLNDLVFGQMVEFANGNYHPVVRYNAMRMIGALNAKRPGFGEDPKPLPKALPMLLSALADENLPDAVRLAALLGVIRHTKYGAADEDSRRKIGGAMLSLAVTRDPPPRRSKQGHVWFRRLAIGTLGRLGSPGAQGTVAKAIVNILSESDPPLSLRCEAAGALGRLKLTSQTGLDPAATGEALEELLIDVAKEQIRLHKEDEQYLVDARKVKACLISIRAALAGDKGPSSKGILGLVPKSDEGKAQEKVLRSLQRKIDNLLSKDYLDHEDLVLKVEKKRPDAKKDPFQLGGGPEGMAPEGMMGFQGPGAGLMGRPGDMTQPGQPDPALKAISEKIMAELVKMVEQYERRQAGG